MKKDQKKEEEKLLQKIIKFQKEEKLFQRIIKFLNEVQLDTEWWTEQLLRPTRYHKSVKEVIEEILMQEESLCSDIVREKSEDVQTIANYKNRLRRATKLINELKEIK